MIREALELKRVFKNRRLPRNKLEALRNQKLRAVVRNAYEHVPYYQSLFRSAGISPGDIRTVADLRHVPVTTKEDLKDAGFDNCTAGWVDRSSLITMQTSGSTGKPFHVHRSPTEWRIARALNMASLMTCGFGPKDRLAILGPEWTVRQRLLHWLGLYRSEVIPLPVTADWQLKRLKELQPTVVWTYPSVLRLLIHNLDYPLGELIRPRVVITFAEMFDPVLRKRVATELDPELFSLYGATEFGRIAWECPEHDGLHLNADHFVLECVDDPPLPDVEGVGKAVLTNLFGFAMP
ncbi:MAG: AMP-binding protein, partial [Deltaproteobacteria bacterium]